MPALREVGVNRLAINDRHIQHTILILNNIFATSLEQRLYLVSIVPLATLFRRKIIRVAFFTRTQIAEVLSIIVYLVVRLALRVEALKRRRRLDENTPVRFGVLHILVQPTVRRGLVEVHNDSTPAHAPHIKRRISTDTGHNGGQYFRGATGSFVYPCECPVGRQNLTGIVSSLEGEQVELNMGSGTIRKRNDINTAKRSYGTGDAAALRREDFEDTLSGHAREFRIGRTNNTDARIPNTVRSRSLSASISQYVNSAHTRLTGTIGSAHHLDELIAFVERLTSGRHDVVKHS